MKKILTLSLFLALPAFGGLEVKEKLRSEHLKGIKVAVASRSAEINDQDFILAVGGSYDSISELSDAKALNQVMKDAKFFTGYDDFDKLVMTYGTARKTNDVKSADKMLKLFFFNMQEMVDRNPGNTDTTKLVTDMITDTMIETGALLNKGKSEVRLLKSDLYVVDGKSSEVDSLGLTFIAIDKAIKEFVMIIDMSYQD